MKTTIKILVAALTLTLATTVHAEDISSCSFSRSESSAKLMTLVQVGFASVPELIEKMIALNEELSPERGMQNPKIALSDTVVCAENSKNIDFESVRVEMLKQLTTKK